MRGVFNKQATSMFFIKRRYCTTPVSMHIHMPVRMEGRCGCRWSKHGKTHFTCSACGKWYHVACFAVAHGVAGKEDSEEDAEGEREEDEEEESEEDEEEESEEDEEEESEGDEEEEMEEDGEEGSA